MNVLLNHSLSLIIPAISRKITFLNFKNSKQKIDKNIIKLKQYLILLKLKYHTLVKYFLTEFYMNQFKKRCAYFELEQALEQSLNFEDKVKTVNSISLWASHHLGFNQSETEAYARKHIANIIRENEVSKMLRRIEKDLELKNIEFDNQTLIQTSNELLKSIQSSLKK
jgi:hypothetical protein